jgi:hypothetical protein
VNSEGFNAAIIKRFVKTPKAPMHYADAYADLLQEENTIHSLKSTVEVVQANRA